MKIKTISVAYSDGAIYNTDGLELSLECSVDISGYRVIMIDSCGLYKLTQYLYDKGIITPLTIPIQIHAEDITLVLDKSIDGYIITRKEIDNEK